MASVSAPGGRSGGGKKNVNVELNLVPFIDLLTCLICFLLMTAVWVEVGRISITQAGQGAPTETTLERDQFNLVLTITPQGFLLTGNGQPLEGGDILKRDNQYDFEKLGVKLKEVHGMFADKSDIVVMSEDAIKYQDLVDTLDVCLANDFPNISVSGTI